MPVADLSPDDDWLQQFLAGHAAGQALGANPAFGASQPYGPSGYPDNLPNMAYGPPGGGVVGYQGATPGAPSMGYPAMGRPNAQQPPAAAPGPAQGLSLTNNPVMRGLNYLNPISSAQADVLHPNLSHPNLSSPLRGGGAPSPSPLLRAGAADSLPLAFGNPTSQDYQEWLSRQLATSSPAATTTANPYAGMQPGLSAPNYTNPMLAAGAGPGAGLNAGTPIATTRTPRSSGSSAAPAPAAQPAAAAPAGSPSATPRPASSSSRFVQVDRPNMPAAGGPRGGPPQMTALNLAGLFGGRGGGQPAASPADVPAANAQPVSGALAPSGMSNAPWGMGPLQQWMNWPGSFGPFTPGQSSGRSLKQRYG